MDDSIITKREDFYKKRDSREPSTSLLEMVMLNSSHPSVYYDLKTEKYMVKIQIPIQKQDIEKGILMQHFVKKSEMYIKTEELPEWFKVLRKEIEDTFQQYWLIKRLL